MNFGNLTTKEFLQKGEYDQNDFAVIQYDDLYDYVQNFKDILKVYLNRAESSLSCDTRSADNYREEIEFLKKALNN